MGQKNCKSSEAELRCDRDTVNSNVNMLYVAERNFNSKNIEHYQLNELTCIYTNADSFMNKYDDHGSFVQSRICLRSINVSTNR